MLRQIISGSRQIDPDPLRTPTLHSSRPRRVCADCQQAKDTMRPLYRMNGLRYCAACLQTWCASLPAVQADLLTWALLEQEG
jgi:hypothetical protein